MEEVQLHKAQDAASNSQGTARADSLLDEVWSYTSELDAALDAYERIGPYLPLYRVVLKRLLPCIEWSEIVPQATESARERMRQTISEKIKSVRTAWQALAGDDGMSELELLLADAIDQGDRRREAEAYAALQDAWEVRTITSAQIRKRPRIAELHTHSSALVAIPCHCPCSCNCTETLTTTLATTATGN